MQALRRQISNERGIGLVGAMLIVSLLAILGGIIASIAVNERRTAFNDVLHSSSLVAADSGTEHAIAWLLLQDDAPAFTNFATRQVGAQSLATLETHSDQRFEYSLAIALDANGRPDLGSVIGYSAEGFQQVTYDVDSSGEAGLDGHSDVTVVVTKIYTHGYN
jgi:type II secretory pathway component PulK